MSQITTFCLEGTDGPAAEVFPCAVTGRWALSHRRRAEYIGMQGKVFGGGRPDAATRRFIAPGTPGMGQGDRMVAPGDRQGVKGESP